MNTLYVCVHVPEFSAQALVRLRPDLATLPVVVLQGEPPFELVCGVNIPARRLGVRHRMTRTELESFSDLHILRQSQPEERSAQAALLDAAGLFTPRVQVQPANDHAWAMVLDMAGTDLIFGPIEKAAQRMQDAFKLMHFSARIAASANFHAALCIAPSALRKPAVIPPGTEAQHLAPLPLARLGLTPQQAESFELWGIRTVGELAALPEVDLVVRLGQQGKRLRLLARGEHPHLMVPQEQDFVLEEVLELDSPVDILESLLFVLAPMLLQLIARAQNHAVGLATVTLTLTLDGGGEHIRTIKPALPVIDSKLLLKLLHLDLQAHPPPAGVVRLFVSAEPGERGKAQLGLWSPQLPEPMRLDITLARIAALVGEDHVGCAVLEDTHSDEGFRMKRFTVPTVPSKTISARPSIALRYCRPPAILQASLDRGSLSAFRWNGARYAVQHAYGPWRKSGDWWSSQVWSAEEWDVQAAAADSSILCVLTHDLLSKQWYMKALYD